MTAARRVALLVAGLLALTAVAAPARADETGLPLPGLRGGELRRTDLEQGSTIVVVWASWSPKCRDIAERVNALSSRWGGRARVVTVNYQEDAQAVEAFLAKSGLQAPVHLDRFGAFAKHRKVTTLPGLLVFTGGRVAYNGELPENADGVLGGIFP